MAYNWFEYCTYFCKYGVFLFKYGAKIHLLFEKEIINDKCAIQKRDS